MIGIENIAEMLGAEIVGEIPDVGPGVFGASKMVKVISDLTDSSVVLFPRGTESVASSPTGLLPVARTMPAELRSFFEPQPNEGYPEPGSLDMF